LSAQINVELLVPYDAASALAFGFQWSTGLRAAAASSRRPMRVVAQTLCDIKSVHAFAQLTFVCENHFEHRRSTERFFVVAGEALGNLTRIENGGF
jgi:hypothetical protein